jgi:hypothetical protein
VSWVGREWAERQHLIGWPKAVLWQLGDCHNEKTGLCNPTVETLSQKRLGCSRNIILRSLRHLIERGLISRRRRWRKPTEYTLHLDQRESHDAMTFTRPNESHVLTQTKARRGDEKKTLGTEERAALPARAPSHEQGQRAAAPPDRSEIIGEAARARERSLALSHAHGNGRAAHEHEARHGRAVDPPVRNGHDPSKEAAPMTAQEVRNFRDLRIQALPPVEALQAHDALCQVTKSNETASWMLMFVGWEAQRKGVALDVAVAAFCQRLGPPP